MISPRTVPVVLADRLVQRHAASPLASSHEPWKAQSLAKGSAGIALMHIERAYSGAEIWHQAHVSIKQAASADISAADSTGLFLGAPAIAFVLNAGGRYRRALETLDTHVHQLAHRRVEAAMARINRGAFPAFGEYDIFYGLTGIGAHLLRRTPNGSALERILSYLVMLTRPLRNGDDELPGWWVHHDPHGRAPTGHHIGGHANFGAAHGITGPLLLLSQAARRGITVDGQDAAIASIIDWFGRWQQDGEAGPWWPEYITRHDLRTGKPTQPGPARPSWCYGTPGIARAGQLAAIATADSVRQRFFEDALHACLADPAQTSTLTCAGLCHGWAGVFQTAWRAARDAITPMLAAVLPMLADRLVEHASAAGNAEPGLLDGSAGTVLALHTAASDAAPLSGWDACLLID
ncbi:lanthionine synthetase C family protein [Actinomadura nitritigenes]|uniref:Lanthionine synthetase C family protein n=2 Tax=Actinomadura nitritigenes TaxID=134602 RepID=A0ABS3R2N0_9ACTN|nr:lanthionine synthetase C family protein [Actinomadura nitritigenes]